MTPTTIDDLPIELLDEIFAYVHPVINTDPIIPINTVCRRWNRPFMTHTLYSTRLPANIDLQTKFPKLVYFELDLDAELYNDLSLFQGHPFLKKLWLEMTGLVASVLNCPRLTSLGLYNVTTDVFFKEDHLDIFLALLPRLESLYMRVYCDTDLESELVPSYNQKLAEILQSRPHQQLKLKILSLDCDVDCISFCQLLQTSSLEQLRFDNEWTTSEQIRNCLACFPNLRSLWTCGTSILSFDIRFDSITTFKLWHGSSTETVRFSSLINRFPNLESLDIGDCPILFDLESPTRLTFLKVAFSGVVQPRLFPHLLTLDWAIQPSQFDYIMQELGAHCPHLKSIKMNLRIERTDWIIEPELDNIVFPELINLELYNVSFKFNSSLSRFLARHDRL